MIGNKESYIPEGNSPILANSGFVHTDDITYNPDTKTVTCSKSGGGYTSQLYSKSGYKDNVFLTFKPSQTSTSAFIGLDANPSEISATSIDYAFVIEASGTSTGNLYVYESGTAYPLPSGHTTYAVGDELRIEYSGGYVRYYHNGVLVRSVARAIGNPLYLDSSFYNSGSVYDVEFGAGLGNINVIDQPTLTDAFTINTSVATSGASTSIQKNGSIVCMYLDIYVTASGTNVDVGTLADGYKTNRQFYITGYDATDNKAVLVWVNTNGNVRIYNGVNGHEYVIFATYFSAT